MKRFLKRLVNARLMRRLRVAEARAMELERQAEASAARLDVLTGHVEILESVIARERARVLAETQIHALAQASAEKGTIR